MSELNQEHRLAMDFAEEAFLARLRGDHQSSVQLAGQALQHEKAAARLVADDLDLEPTRSVLHRSAASLALQAREYREAERLIATGLAGNPPPEIADELRELYDHVRTEILLE